MLRAWNPTVLKVCHQDVEEHPYVFGDSDGMHVPFHPQPNTPIRLVPDFQGHAIFSFISQVLYMLYIPTSLAKWTLGCVAMLCRSLFQMEIIHCLIVLTSFQQYFIHIPIKISKYKYKKIDRLIYKLEWRWNKLAILA